VASRVLGGPVRLSALAAPRAVRLPASVLRGDRRAHCRGGTEVRNDGAFPITTRRPAMRIRIIIDTDDADDPSVVESSAPFTLNVFKDDGAASREPLEIESESVIIGDDIAWMLHELARAWSCGHVHAQMDVQLPLTDAEWRRYESG